MATRTDHIPVITAAGWVLAGKCRCGGTLKEKYQKTSKNKLIVYPERGKYILKLFGQPAVRGELSNIAASLN